MYVWYNKPAYVCVYVCTYTSMSCMCICMPPCACRYVCTGMMHTHTHAHKHTNTHEHRPPGLVIAPSALTWTNKTWSNSKQRGRSTQARLQKSRCSTREGARRRGIGTSRYWNDDADAEENENDSNITITIWKRRAGFDDKLAYTCTHYIVCLYAWLVLYVYREQARAG